MTRGQDTLVMELGGMTSFEEITPVDVSALIVLHATPEEEAAHDAVLNLIEKESKGVTVWRRSFGVPAPEAMAA